MPVDRQHVCAVAGAEVNLSERAAHENGIRRDDRFYNHRLDVASAVVPAVAPTVVEDRAYLRLLDRHRITFDPEALALLDAQDLIGFSSDQQHVAGPQNRLSVRQYAF